MDKIEKKQEEEEKEANRQECIVLPIGEVVKKDSPEVVIKPQLVRLKLSQLFHQIKWSNVIILLVLHLLAIVGYVHCLTHPVKVITVVFAGLLTAFSGFGMSVGAHRLWAHRSFKARLPLRILLALLQAMTMNGSAFSYARDHRTHHKNTDTERDPKNPSRGLFYSHIGWWLLKKNQAVKDAGAKLDFSDLKNDWIVWYQHKLYIPLFVLLGVAFPTLLPYYLFDENLLSSFYACAVIRTLLVLHHLFTVNSLAHFFGHRPYDFRMRPTENRLVIYLSLGEGNHNYHHTFPYDYASSEKRSWEFFNPSTVFIDFHAFLGLAYDRKRASKAVVEGTVRRIGVPAYFDPPRSCCFRIVNGIFDWFLGILLALWPIYPAIIYKWLTGQQIFIV